MRSGSCRTTCAKSLFQAPFGHLYLSVSGSLCEDPFGPLVSGSCRTTGARSLYQDFFGPLYQDTFQVPVRPVSVVRISAS